MSGSRSGIGRGRRYEALPLPATAAALAAEVAELSRVNLALVLESARSWSESEEALRHEAALSALAISSRDGQEGITAFLAKRSPSFDRG